MMKRQSIIKNVLTAVMVASCIMFTACGKGQNGGPINTGDNGPNVSDSTDGEKPVDTDGTGTEAGNTQTGQSGEAGGADPTESTDGKIHVSSAEEFLNAIAPDTDIVFEPGKYNLSNYLESDLDVEDWNKNHRYAKIRNQFDGYELVIQDVSGLSISGGSDNAADTEIVINPRYSSVIWFNACNDIEVSNVTMGHIEGGECIGNVLDFDYCSNVTVKNADLYGCGVYAIGTSNYTENVHVVDSTLRDCSAGPLSIDRPKGEYLFENCKFTGSMFGGSVWSEEKVNIRFVDCVFGQEESNFWSYFEDAVMENCDLQEPTYYPEYGYSDEEYETFNTDDLTLVSFDDVMLDYSTWNGFARVDSSNGNTDYLDTYSAEVLDTINLSFGDEGKVSFNYFGEEGTYTWEVLDENQAVLKNDDENLYFEMYENSYHSRWLKLQYNNYVIWMIQ